MTVRSIDLERFNLDSAFLGIFCS